MMPVNVLKDVPPITSQQLSVYDFIPKNIWVMQLDNEAHQQIIL